MKAPSLFQLAVALSAFALLPAGTGCQTSAVDTVQPAERRGEANVVEDERIITDRRLGRILEVRGVNEAVVSNDLLRVQVELRNTRQGLRRFNYQFQWFDDEGMIVQQATTPWRALQMEGGEIVSITGVAPNPRVTDFRLNLMTSTR